MSYQRCYYYICGFAAVESKTDRTGLFIKQTQLQARFRANPNSITTNRPIGCQNDSGWCLNLWLSFQRSSSKSCYKRQLHSNRTNTTITEYMAKHSCVYKYRVHTFTYLFIKYIYIFIVPPTGSRMCVIFKMLWIQHLVFTRFASNFIWIMSKHGRCKTVEGILISKILLPWQPVKLEYSFTVILRQITCLYIYMFKSFYTEKEWFIANKILLYYIMV